jgi:O-methyltransferase
VKVSFAKRVRNQFLKLRWFLSNYRKIHPGIEFLPAVFQGPVTYQADGVITSNNCDFINEPRFKKAYLAAEATNPWKGFSMPWRVYIVCSLADQVKHLKGDFVECGVNTGAYSRAVIDYINFNSLDKTFYLLDTYQGLVREQVTDEELKAGVGEYLNAYVDVYEQVIETFRPFRTKVIKGAVPGTLSQCNSNQIAYLSIDMNVVEPEIAAANYFWDKLVSGGVMILDDYGFPAHLAQKKAFDHFAKEKSVSIIYIPTGQAIIFKP